MVDAVDYPSFSRAVLGALEIAETLVVKSAQVFPVTGDCLSIGADSDSINTLFEKFVNWVPRSWYRLWWRSTSIAFLRPRF